MLDGLSDFFEKTRRRRSLSAAVRRGQMMPGLRSLTANSLTLGLDKYDDASHEERAEIFARVEAYHRGDRNWRDATPKGYPNIRSTP